MDENQQLLTTQGILTHEEERFGLLLLGVHLMHTSVLHSTGLLAGYNTVKPVLSDLVWAHKKWSLYEGGLLKEVKMNRNSAIQA